MTYISNYASLQDRIAQRLQKPFDSVMVQAEISREKFGSGSIEIYLRRLIPGTTPGKKYTYRMENRYTKDTEKFTGEADTKKELYEEVSKVLKKLGFKDNPNSFSPNIDSLDLSENDIPVNNRFINSDLPEPVQSLLEGYLVVTEDEYTGFTSSLRHTALLDNLNPTHIERFLEEVSAIARKKNNGKFDTREKEMKEIVDRWKKKKQVEAQAQEFISKPLFTYTGTHAVVNKVIEDWSKKMKETDTKEINEEAMEAVAQFQKHLDTYPEVFAKVPTTRSKYTSRAQTEKEMDELLESVPFSEYEEVKRSLQQVYYHIPKEEQEEIKYAYKVETDEYGSTSGNQRVYFNSETEAHNYAKSLTVDNPLVSDFTIVYKDSLEGGRLETFGTPYEVHITAKELFKQLSDSWSSPFNQVIFHSMKNRTSSEPLPTTFSELKTSNYTLALKEPIVVNEFQEMIRTQSRNTVIEYIAAKARNAIATTEHRKEVLPIKFYIY